MTKRTIEIENLVRAEKPRQVVPQKTPLLVKGIRLGFQTVGRLAPYAAGRQAFKLFTTPRKRARHRKSDALLEAAQRGSFEFENHTIRTYTWGAGAETILLIHGWQSRGTALRSFVPPLLEQGYKIVAVDGPAHGESSGEQLTLPLFASVIARVWDAQRSVAGVITHSFGGPSTLYMMGYLSDSKRRFLPKFGMVAAPSSIQNVVNNASNFMRLPSRVRQTFSQEVEATAQQKLQDLEFEHFPAKEQIGELLIFHDRFDPVNPFSDALELADHFAQAKIIATEGLGHFRLVKHPKVIDRMAHFFQKK